MERRWAGIGLRDAHVTRVLAERPPLGHVEVISENYTYTRGPRRRALLRARELYPVHLHGVSMNLASTDALSDEHLTALRALAEEVEPSLVSDHLCWTAVEGRHSYDLLPFPFTEEALAHVSARVLNVQERLGRPLALENTSSYLRFASDELSEWQFIGELLGRTGASLLFDVNNLWVNAQNHAYPPRAALELVRPERVAAYHLAGHERRPSFLFDTHDRPVCAEVWQLFDEVVRAVGPRPATLEWDEAIPPLEVLLGEVRRIEGICRACPAEGPRG